MTNSTLHRTVPFVDLSAQYKSIEAEINAQITEILHKTNFILGEEVSLFEREFADFCGVAHAVGVDSGTSALELILKAYDIGPGDEVITVANTFIATTLAISYNGATPVLVDVDPNTYMMNNASLEEAITDRTKAIMPVHLYGHPVDMDVVNSLADQYELIVIEDASQAHGARYKGSRVGSLGHSAVFSLYPAKNLGAYGDAGIIVTKDDQIAEKLRLLRNYGSVEKYHHLELGFNRRLDTLQAAVLRVKLQYIDDWNKARREHAKLYNEFLKEAEIGLPGSEGHAEHVYHLYVIRADHRDDLQAFLMDKGISTGIHYPIPIHLQPAYRELPYKKGDFPITESLSEQILSLPMYPELTPEMIEYVVAGVREFIADQRAEPIPSLIAP